MMAARRDLVWLPSRALTMHAMPSLNLTATNGRGVCLRSVRIVLQDLQVPATDPVLVLGVAWAPVEASLAGLGLVAVAPLGVALGDAVGLVVIPTAVPHLVMTLVPFLRVQLLHQTRSQTMPRQGVSVARLSTFAM